MRGAATVFRRPTHWRGSGTDGRTDADGGTDSQHSHVTHFGWPVSYLTDLLFYLSERELLGMAREWRER